jgi:hypothetical protein
MILLQHVRVIDLSKSLSGQRIGGAIDLFVRILSNSVVLQLHGHFCTQVFAAS